MTFTDCNDFYKGLHQERFVEMMSKRFLDLDQNEIAKHAFLLVDRKGYLMLLVGVFGFKGMHSYWSIEKII